MMKRTNPFSTMFAPARIMAGCAALCLCGIILTANAADVETLKIGAKAPDFQLIGVDDEFYSLKNFSSAKILAILFTCNHCPTAQAYEPRIIQMVKDYQPKGVAFAAISPNDDKAVRLDELGYTDLGDSLEDMKKRAAHKEFNFPYLYDGDTQAATKLYGPMATPHMFIFDEGRLLRYVGAIDDNENIGKAKTHFARNALDALLEGSDVPTPTTKTFGCSIKWADKRASAREALSNWNQEKAELSGIGLDGIAELVKNDTDKLRLINVWATWCGPCVTEFPELITMHRMYRKRPFEMITLSANDQDDKDEVAKFLNEQHASCVNYIFSGDNKIEMMDAVDKQSSGALPYTLLVKPGGEIVFRHDGEIDPLELRREIIKIIGNTY